MKTEVYPLGIRVLHCLMAFAILGLIATGWYMAGLPADAENKHALYPWHKSFGVMVIIAFVLRLSIRIRSKVPDAPEVLKAWEKTASHLAHKALYLLMAAVPVSGYIMSASYAQSHGIDFFGTTLPGLVPKNETLFEVVHAIHGPVAYSLAAIVFIHIAAVIKHRMFDDKAADVLPRMGLGNR